MVLFHIVQGAIILIYLQHIHWNKFNILKNKSIFWVKNMKN
jgi:hypothetical protein